VSLLQDYTEFIRTLNTHRVRYLVIGGHAVAFHGHPRNTDDIGVLVEKTEANLRRVEAALGAFVGTKLRPELLRRPRGMVRIGGEVVHVDVTTKVDGLSAFGPLWERRVRGELLGEPVSYISLRDLLRTKRATNRPKDWGDIEALEALARPSGRRR
jgi:hypothetical protein